MFTLPRYTFRIFTLPDITRPPPPALCKLARLELRLRVPLYCFLVVASSILCNTYGIPQQLTISDMFADYWRHCSYSMGHMFVSTSSCVHIFPRIQISDVNPHNLKPGMSAELSKGGGGALWKLIIMTAVERLNY